MQKAAQFWGISFILLFALSQLLDWLQRTPLPFPVFVMTGMALAAWSNYEQSKSFLLGSKLTFLLKTTKTQRYEDL